MLLSDPTPLLTMPVVPVVTIERVEDAVPLARALLAGGLPVLEITLRTPAALDAARAILAEVPDVIVGVGTVIKPLDVTHAIDAGADFLVSAGTPANLAQALADAPVPALPGCATVAEAMTLAALGFPVLKLFPAEAAGGIKALKALAGPFGKVRFCPTGGISEANAADWLALDPVLCVGGSWVVKPGAPDVGAIRTAAEAASRLRPS